MKIKNELLNKDIVVAVVYKGTTMQVEIDTYYITPEKVIFHVELTNKDLRKLEIFNGAKQ